MITFIDDASGFATLHFLRSKADAVTALQDLVSWAEAQTGYCLCSIRSDRGGEYSNSKNPFHTNLNVALVELKVEYTLGYKITPFVM